MNAIYHDIDSCQQKMIQSPVAGACKEENYDSYFRHTR